MKKMLVALIALSMTAAMAHNHNMGHENHKHMGMVTLDFTNSTTRSNTFDLAFSDGDGQKPERSLVLNYTHAFTGHIMAGLTLKNVKDSTGETTEGLGVQFYYNLAGQINDTCYVGLSYMMEAEDKSEDEMTTTSLFYGHRFSIGSWKKFHLTYSPQIAYNMTSNEPKTGAETDSNSLAFNWIKFDVLF